MGIVVIADQQESRRGPDRVEGALGQLNLDIGSGLRRGLVRTAGDEMQAVIGEPSALTGVIEFCLRHGGWWLGIGLGEIESLGETARDSRGAAFAAAREAIERAKKRRRHAIAVAGEPEELAKRLEGMCEALAFIAERRTERQWQIVDATREAGTGSWAAETLGITPQTANESLRAGGVREQFALEQEIAYLAAKALSEEQGG
jgi:hypothetical protein